MSPLRTRGIAGSAVNGHVLRSSERSFASSRSISSSENPVPTFPTQRSSSPRRIPSTSEPKSRSRRPLPFVHPQIKNSCRKVVFSLSQSRLRLPGSYLELAFFAITPSRPWFFAAFMSAGPSSNVSESLTAALSGMSRSRSRSCRSVKGRSTTASPSISSTSKA